MRERLYRSRTDRMILGVAGGMARWLDVDPSLVRLVWVVLVIAGGIGLLLYIVAAIIIPEEPLGAAGTTASAAGGLAGAEGPTGPTAEPSRRDAGSAPMIVGIVLVLLGAWFLLRRYVPFFDADLFWPALLIVIGLLLVFGALRRPSGPRT